MTKDKMIIKLAFNANDIAFHIRNFIDKTSYYINRGAKYEFHLECCIISEKPDLAQAVCRESDVINLQYLFCFVELLLKNEVDFNFIFEFNNGDISDDYYFSLRNAAAFYIKHHGSQIANRLSVMRNGRNNFLFSKEALASGAVEDAIKVGRILPLIPITESNYKGLITTMPSECFGELYNEYYYAIISREYEQELSKYLNTDLTCHDAKKMTDEIIRNKKLFFDKECSDFLTNLIEFLIRQFKYFKGDIGNNHAKFLDIGLSSDIIVEEMQRIYAKNIPSMLLGLERTISKRNISSNLFKNIKADSARFIINLIVRCVNKRLAFFSKWLSSKSYDKIIKSRLDDRYRYVLRYLCDDTVLDSLIFISTLYYVTDDKKQKFPNLKELDLLHETCVDYSQGIIQLIENAYNHAVKDDNGAANFTIRIRTKKNAEALYIAENSGAESEKSFFDVTYFMELYITDLQFNDFKGIKTKFIENVKKQCDDVVWENFWKKRFGDDAVSDGWEQFKKNIKENEREFGRGITLDGLFKGCGKELIQYLSMHQNVVFHYGLQILDSVIRSADGYLQVVSIDKNVKDEREENGRYEIDNNKYDVGKTNWENGTAYIIYLPIKKSSPVNYSDTVATSAQDLGAGYEFYNIEVNWKSLFDEFGNGMSVDDKSKTVCSIVNQIFENNDLIGGDDTQTDKSIYYIDCEGVHSQWFELLAKSLFMMLAQRRFVPKHIALINVENSYSVVKIFRQFALFYNREGESNVMNGKSVFIVDKQAEIDLLLSDKIIKIVDNLYRYQIDGSMNEQAMNIIRHLGGGRQNG